eukprot:469716-Pyramimonas_sp.AAC.1
MRAGLDLRKTFSIKARVIRVAATITDGPCTGYTLKHWNIHDHDLSREQVRRVAGEIQADLRDMEVDPRRRCAAIVGGFNYGENVE